MVDIDWMGIAQVITALGILIIGVISALNSKTISTVKEKTVAIEAHVNSEKTADLLKIEYLQRENNLKQKMLEEKDKVAQLLAQSAAVALAYSTPSKVLVGVETDTEKLAETGEKILKSIDKNTENIDMNTKTLLKNDAVIKEEKRKEK